MLELIALVAFAMALAAFLGGRRTADRLDTEIESLKAEIARLAAQAPADAIPDPTASARKDAGVPAASEVGESSVATRPVARERRKRKAANLSSPQAPNPSSSGLRRASRAVSADAGRSGSAGSRWRWAVTSWCNIRSMRVS